MTTLLFYRTRVLEADITGDTRQTSRFFQPNFGQQHAGSITAADDEDMFRVYLREGRTYTFELLGNTFELLGNSSNGNQGTTLGDPQLQLLDSLGMVAEDDNSGSGTNARASFTPSRDVLRSAGRRFKVRGTSPVPFSFPEALKTLFQFLV